MNYEEARKLAQDMADETDAGHIVYLRETGQKKMFYDDDCIPNPIRLYGVVSTKDANDDQFGWSVACAYPKEG